MFREEQARRRAQAERASKLRQITADKISARSFVKAYLEPLLPNVFEQLTARGYFYDDVETGTRSKLVVTFCSDKSMSQSLFQRLKNISTTLFSAAFTTTMSARDVLASSWMGLLERCAYFTPEISKLLIRCEFKNINLIFRQPRSVMLPIVSLDAS